MINWDRPELALEHGTAERLGWEFQTNMYWGFLMMAIGIVLDDFIVTGLWWTIIIVFILGVSAPVSTAITIGPGFDIPDEPAVVTTSVGPRSNDSDVNPAEHIQNLFGKIGNGTACVQSGLCTLSTSVVRVTGASGDRKRRDTEATTKYRVILSITGSVSHIDYYPDGIYNASAGNLIHLNYQTIWFSVYLWMKISLVLHILC